MIDKEDLHEARELVFGAVSKKPKTAKELAEDLNIGFNSRTVSQLLKTFVSAGKVLKTFDSRVHKRFYCLPEDMTAKSVSTKAPLVTSPFGTTERHMLVYKEEGRWIAEVFINESAAMDRGHVLSETHPGMAVFYGKASRRLFTDKPKVRVDVLD